MLYTQFWAMLTLFPVIKKKQNRSAPTSRNLSRSVWGTGEVCQVFWRFLQTISEFIVVIAMVQFLNLSFWDQFWNRGIQKILEPYLFYVDQPAPLLKTIESVSMLIPRVGGGGPWASAHTSLGFFLHASDLLDRP